jgi:hypothetical protein
MAKWRVVCLLVVLVLGGCGSGDSTRVSAAVNTVEPLLRSIWSESYAGLGGDDDRLVIYRKPDAKLDAFVRERVEGVDVEFRDAPYSLDDLEPLAARVTGDWHYWATRQVTVQMVHPRFDGTGVTVVVATGDLGAAEQEFRQRYGDEPVLVRRPARTGVGPATFDGQRSGRNSRAST